MAMDAYRLPVRSVARGGVLLLVLAFITAIFFANESSARSGYPFLNADRPRAPDILYYPTYVPTGTRPISLSAGDDKYGNVGLEVRSLLASGAELRVWETTRHDATVSDAAGPIINDSQLRGSLAVWRSGHTQDGRANVLHARIGQTLIVIIGALAPDELLQIADSLRRTSSSALRL